MKRCRAHATFAAIALVAITSTAHAEDDAARAHFDEGRRLAHAEHWQEAATEFRASLAIEPSVGGHLNLGNVYAKLGRTASAVDQFRRAERLAGPKDPERANHARTRKIAATHVGGGKITIAQIGFLELGHLHIGL